MKPSNELDISRLRRSVTRDHIPRMVTRSRSLLAIQVLQFGSQLGVEGSTVDQANRSVDRDVRKLCIRFWHRVLAQGLGMSIPCPLHVRETYLRISDALRPFETALRHRPARSEHATGTRRTSTLAWISESPCLSRVRFLSPSPSGALLSLRIPR